MRKSCGSRNRAACVRSRAFREFAHRYLIDTCFKLFKDYFKASLHIPLDFVSGLWAIWQSVSKNYFGWFKEMKNYQYERPNVVGNWRNLSKNQPLMALNFGRVGSGMMCRRLRCKWWLLFHLIYLKITGFSTQVYIRLAWRQRTNKIELAWVTRP